MNNASSGRRTNFRNMVSNNTNCIFNIRNEHISMSVGRYILVFFGLIIGISMALGDCEFTKPETIIGKANVLNAVQFQKPKRNKCFQDRGAQLGKIEFQYEFPEGSNIQHQVIVYYDATSQCFFNGHE